MIAPALTFAWSQPLLTTLAIYLHRIDPYLVELWHNGPIRWYGISYLVGFALGYLLVRRVTTVGQSPLHPSRSADLVFALAVGIFAGGRLGYILFYRPDLIISFTSEPPFWGVLAINQGGMSSHGGMIGLIIASWLFARFTKVSWAYVLDLGAFGAPLGLFFGRIANFVNGELFGRPAPAGLPWAVKFPQELYHDESLRNAAMQQLYQQGLITPDASVQSVIERIQAGQSEVIAAVEPLLTARHPSQLYEALLEGLLLFAVLLWVWRKPQKPAVVGSTFCLTYGIVRIIAEFFREPDTHLKDAEFAMVGITRGQWLSVLLALVGLVGLWIATRRNVPKVGSWRRVENAQPQS